MFKRSLLALAVLSSSSAFATTEVQTSSPITFAEELFGTSNAVLGAGVNQVVDIGNAVSNMATATFTYTLNNGTYGVTPTLTFANGGGTGAAGISLTSGGAGSDTVVFTVVTTDVFDGDETFTLNVSTLAGTDTLGTVGNTVTATLTVNNTNIVATPFVQTVTYQTTKADDTQLAVSDEGMVLGVTGGGATDILVTDQTKFVGTVDNQVLFGNLSITNANAAKNEGGVANFALAANDAVVITVSGTIAEGASVCLVDDGDTDCSSPVGTFTTTTSGSTINLTGAQAAGLVGDEDIIYLNGTNTIPVSDFTISAEITYGNTAYAGAVTYSSTATADLGISGLTEVSERINIITKPGGGEETFIRVTNNNTGAAEAYINLQLADGTTKFGYLGSIAGNNTVSYSSQNIADAVGLSTWAGRANATLSFSQGANMVVVPLLRSDGVLTNQTSALTN